MSNIGGGSGIYPTTGTNGIAYFDRTAGKIELTEASNLIGFGGVPTAKVESKITPKIGTGTISSVGTAITGTATAFTTELLLNNRITAAGETRRIVSITDDTNLEVDLAFSAPLTAEAFTYSIQSAKFGDGVNYIEIEADGHLNFVGDAKPYTDMDVFITEKSGAGINSPDFIPFKNNGAVSKGVYNYAFSPTAAEELFFDAKVLHNYAEGTGWDFHIHWTPSTNDTGNVCWSLEYTWVEKNVAAPDTTIVITPIAADGVDRKHQVNDVIAFISGAGKKIGAVVSGRIFRDATNPLDTYPADAFLLAADFHYQADGIGTRNQGTK
jgi:hypothetical protein